MKFDMYFENLHRVSYQPSSAPRINDTDWILQVCKGLGCTACLAIESDQIALRVQAQYMLYNMYINIFPYRNQMKNSVLL